MILKPLSPKTLNQVLSCAFSATGSFLLLHLTHGCRVELSRFGHLESVSVQGVGIMCGFRFRVKVFRISV